jgi:hypothetical protein
MKAMHYLTLTLSSLLLLASNLLALHLQPEVSVNVDMLQEDFQKDLFDLSEKIEDYVAEVDWDPENEDLTLFVPIVVQFRTATEEGARTVYTANFAGGNQGDIRFDENTWRFTLNSYGRYEHNEDRFDPFLSMIDYHLRLVVAYEYDKLSEFGGDDFFNQARSIADLAMFDEMKDGWSKRREKLERHLVPERQIVRSVRWLTHTAYWFREVGENDYEAWTTMLLAIDLIEEFDNPGVLNDFWKVNYKVVSDIFFKAGDSDNLYRLLRLDTMDPQRAMHYQEQASRASR